MNDSSFIAINHLTVRQSLFRNRKTSLKNESDNENERNGDNGNFWKGLSNLWDEIIEVSTYGPSERKMLKAQRERQRQLSQQDKIGLYDINENDNDDDVWIRSFNSAKTKIWTEGDGDDNVDTADLDYDGYALRDLLVSKWGVPLDVDFQKIGENTLYCTVLPLVGFGSPLRSRHDSELDYLMHLQGVVEVLYKYDNLDQFVTFIEETKKVPKRGTDSVPFRMDISDEQIKDML